MGFILIAWDSSRYQILGRAWELRDVCSTCDALYVALAEALAATLLTRDARLARGVKGVVDVVVSA